MMLHNIRHIRVNVRNMCLEPNGGNLYRPHATITGNGQYWRCQHGKTGREHYRYLECVRCWIGYRLGCLVDKCMGTERCAICMNEKISRNIVGDKLVCDYCYEAMLRSRELQKVPK